MTDMEVDVDERGTLQLPVLWFHGDCSFTRTFSALSPFSAEPFREQMLNGSFNRQLCQGIYSKLPGTAFGLLCNGFSPAMPQGFNLLT